MAERGMSLRQLAKAAGYDPSYLSKVLSGRKPASPYLARCLDEALSADGTIKQAAAQPVPPVPVPGEGPVAPELVDYFSSQLAGHYTADRYLGPTRLIPTAISQYELLCDLAGAGSGYRWRGRTARSADGLGPDASRAIRAAPAHGTVER